MYFTEKGCSCGLACYDNQLTTETGTFICSVYYYKFSEMDTNNFTLSKPIPNLTYMYYNLGNW